MDGKELFVASDADETTSVETAKRSEKVAGYLATASSDWG
jgi:hypothetical protein